MSDTDAREPTTMRMPSSASPPARADLHELLRAAAAGEQAAWTEVVARYNGLVRSVTRGFRLNDEDAADVVQTTWLRLATHMDSINSPGALPSWLMATARHECLKLLRHRREQPTLVEHLDRASDDLGPAEHVVSRDLVDVLGRALATLPAKEVRLLHLLMQSSRPGYAQIAGTLGMPIGSIGPVRSRALARLRAELITVGITDPCL